MKGRRMKASESMTIADILALIAKTGGDSLIDGYRHDLAHRVETRWRKNAQKHEFLEKNPGFPENRDASAEDIQEWQDLRYENLEPLTLEEFSITEALLKDAIDRLIAHDCIGHRLMLSLHSSLRYVDSLSSR